MSTEFTASVSRIGNQRSREALIGPKTNETAVGKTQDPAASTPTNQVFPQAQDSGETIQIAGETQQQNAEISEMVSRIEDYVQDVKRNLHFMIDKDTGKTIIRVYDTKTGALIRQIPMDEMLQIASTLENAKGLLFKGDV